MSENGKLIIRKSKKGKLIFEVDIGKKQPMIIPSFYDLKDDSLNGKECEVEREKGKIVKITIDGIELPKKQKIEMKKDIRSYKNQDTHKQNYRKQYAQNIYSIQKTKLPSDTRNNLNESDIDNFSLKLNKTVNFRFNKEKHEEQAILYKSEYKDKKDNNKLKKFEIEFNFSKLNNIIKSIKHKMDIIKDSYENMGYLISKKEFSPDWRLIIGLGSESVYETSITLHHIYGIPYIPGQAVKGVVRNYLISEVFECKEGNKNKGAFSDEDFCKIFGSPKDSAIGEHIGSVIFFDAFPIEIPTIKPDIMNPHYGDYYSGKKVNGKPVPPADYLNPNPIPFLTVEGTKFQFILGIKEKDNVKIDDGKFRGRYILEVSEKYLKEALEEHGIGAKTAVGYGYMKEK